MTFGTRTEHKKKDLRRTSFRVDTPRELANWSRSLAVTWRDQDARLTVHFEKRFTLTDARRNEGNGRCTGLDGISHLKSWKRSADDGQRMFMARIWSR
ncbi:structural molecule [Desmophyllum pertusum]|uniref:Structural molecule n=1 Tax=Desmophyllum pertusum TaxID=174260 RepID=A0A9X0D7R9_9CNID|nr:structural molecule [Desmophyllum pertusum]